MPQSTCRAGFFSPYWNFGLFWLNIATYFGIISGHNPLYWTQKIYWSHKNQQSLCLWQETELNNSFFEIANAGTSVFILLRYIKMTCIQNERMADYMLWLHYMRKELSKLLRQNKSWNAHHIFVGRYLLIWHCEDLSRHQPFLHIWVKFLHNYEEEISMILHIYDDDDVVSFYWEYRHTLNIKIHCSTLQFLGTH